MIPHRPLKIGLDLDGVLADAIGGMIGWVRLRYGVETERSMYNAWDATIPGVGELRSLFREAYADEESDLIACLDPVEGAQEGVQELRMRGFDLYVITARHKEPVTNLNKTYSWLRAKFGFAEDHVIVHSSRKHEHGMDVLIDDSYRYTIAFARAGGLGILMKSDRSFFRGEKEEPHTNYRTARSWADIRSLIP